MDTDSFIQRLGSYWDVGNFLYNVRQGVFAPDVADEFLEFLKSISFGDDELLPRKLVALLWYLPMFVEWQIPRVQEHSPDLKLRYERFVNHVLNELERILGVP